MTVMALAASALLQAIDEVPEASDVKPGWIALGLMVLLGLATVLLWFSMRKQLKKVDFEVEPSADRHGRTRRTEDERQPGSGDDLIS